MSRHTGTCELATHVDQDTTGGGGNVRGHGRHARVVISPSTRSRITGCSLWWPVPGQCQNRQIGVLGELAKEVIEATARAKERVALPAARVAEVVKSPEPFEATQRSRATGSRDHSGPRSARHGGRRSDDVDRLALPLELDANLVACLCRHPRVAYHANPRDVASGKHEPIVRVRPGRSSVGLGDRAPANLVLEGYGFMRRTLITRREAASLSGITETTVKKAVDQRVVPTRRRGSQSCIEVEDVPVLAMLGLLGKMRLSPSDKRTVRRWLRSPDPPTELELAPALVVRRVDEIEQARLRAERYAALRERWIIRDPAIKNGEPVIRGSRVTVHTLADRIAGGESDEVLDEDFPHIPAEARDIAVQFARANPRRGRPRRPAR